eukprot:6003727-Lingulodinium_polyedra.AAC.1
MFGTAAKPTCKLKAGESWGMMQYLLDKLSHTEAIPDGKELHRSGWHLQEVINVVKAANGGHLPLH